MIRAEIFEAMNAEERRELHTLIMDARQYRYIEDRLAARYDEAARLESVLIAVLKKKGEV